MLYLILFGAGFVLGVRTTVQQAQHKTMFWSMAKSTFETSGE